MGRESFHAVLLDVHVPSAPHRSGGFLPFVRNYPIPSSAVYDRVLRTALNDTASSPMHSALRNDPVIHVARRRPPDFARIGAAKRPAARL